MHLNPTSSQKGKQKLKKIHDRMKKVTIAPGEKGSFQNWADDTYLEEKAFPTLFPFGVGGYLNSNIISQHGV